MVGIESILLFGFLLKVFYSLTNQLGNFQSNLVEIFKTKRKSRQTTSTKDVIWRLSSNEIILLFLSATLITCSHNTPQKSFYFQILSLILIYHIRSHISTVFSKNLAIAVVFLFSFVNLSNHFHMSGYISAYRNAVSRVQKRTGEKPLILLGFPQFFFTN